MAENQVRKHPAVRSGAALLGLVLLLAAAPALAADFESPPEGLDAHAIALRAENALRGEHTFLEATMIIGSQAREIRFQSFDDRIRQRSFIRILAPRKDANATFLKLHPNLWMYAPRDETTTRIRPSMMQESWMGSGFTNDDLVKESSEIDDYEHRLLGIDTKPDDLVGFRAYVVEYEPREGMSGVWGKIVAWIETEHGTPLRKEFYDEKGELLRVMHFGGIREVQGRYFPHVWTVRPQGDRDHETRLEVEQIRFDGEFEESVFTARNLKARE